jgi:hypothetical protein
MFKHLVSGREDLWGDLTEEEFVTAFRARGFELQQRLELKAGHRSLLELKSTDHA